MKIINLSLIVILGFMVINLNSQIFVTLDPGHGGEDPGTMGYNSIGPGESHENLKIALIAAEFLKNIYDWSGFAHEFFPILTRYEDTDVPLSYRPQIAENTREGYSWVDKQWGFWQVSQDFISIHLNALNDQNVDYTSTWYAFDDYLNYSQLMANIISNRLNYIRITYPPPEPEWWEPSIPPYTNFFYQSQNNGAYKNTNLLVLNQLDENISGTLTESVFYTNFNGYIGIRQGNLRFWAAVAIKDFLKNIHGIVGIEDYVYIRDCSNDFPPRLLHQSQANCYLAPFQDEFPLGDPVPTTFYWEFRGLCSDTTVIFQTSNYNNLVISYPDFDNLSYNWKKTSNGNIKGEIWVYASDTVTYSSYWDSLQIEIEYLEPPIITEIQRGNQQLTIKMQNGGLPQYLVHYDTDSAEPPYNGTGATEGNSPITCSGPDSTFSLSGLENGTTYYITLKNKYDQVISPYSNVEYATPITLSGTLSQNEDWPGLGNPANITLEGNVIIPAGDTLTLNSGTIINLNNYYIKSNGGIIEKYSNVTFNPDIRLLNGTTLKGQYPTIQAAMADATSSDQIIVYSNITVTGTLLLACNVLVESGASVTFNQSNTILNGKYIRALNAVNGTFVLNYATFSPDIRLRRGNVIKGFFPRTDVAMQFAASDDLVEINSGDPWNSNFTVVCDVLINPSGEVTIPAAKTILFAPDTRVTVRGDLRSNGQYGANKVYLKAVPGNTWSRGIWDGIWFESGGAGVLNQTCIYNADYGCFLGAGSFFEANNCYFQNNYCGIYGNNASDCTLDWCMFTSNSTAGVTAYPLNFDMGWCTVQGNGDGIQLQSSYPEIDRTKITQNTSRGVVAGAGTIDMGTSSSDYGYNSIYNNSSYEMDVFLYAYVLVCGNYWGGGQPTDIHYNNGGNVIWWPYLPYPPLNKNQITPNEQPIPTLAKPKPGDNVILADPLSLILPAIELRKNKDYAAAASNLEAIINEYPQSEAALAALWELARTYHKAKTDSPGVKLASNLSTTLSRMLPDFKSGKSEVHSQLYPTALKLLTYHYLQTNTPASAIETCQQLIQEFPGTSFEEEGWWSLFNTYYFLLADTSQAKSCYEQLKQNFPKSEFLVHAYHTLDLDDVQPFVKEQLAAEIPPPIPVKYYLSSVYPNPFNSSTIIKYELPESDQVSLKIFNIEGQLVT